MNKVALKTIGFVEQNEVNDQWEQQQAQSDRSLPVVFVDGITRFRSIDQQNASMTEKLTTDESGSRYQQQVQFTVRTEEDRALAKKYERRPLVLHVWAVDGNHYTIGTKTYPAYLRTDKTNSRDVVETSMTVEYETLTAVM